MIISKEQKAFFYMFCATLLFSLVALLAKLLFRLGAVEITFFRNAIGVVFVLFFFRFSRQMRFNRQKLHLLLFRGFIGTVALIAFFYNVGMVSLADAITFTKTEPLFSALLSFWLMKERLTPLKVVAIIVGFLGVFVIGVDRGISLAYANAIGVFAGFCAALAYTTIRRLRDDFDHVYVVLSFMMFGSIIPLLMIFAGSIFGDMGIVKGFVMPSLREVFFLLLLGVLSAAGQVLMTKAYFYANAGLVSTVSYFSIPFGVLFGVAVGDELPTPAVLFGMGLIVVSGVLIAKNSN